MSAPVKRNRFWTCPFWKWDGRNDIHCEGGTIVFPTKEVAEEYMTTYCSALPGWEDCSVAQALYAYYDELEERKNEKHREAEKG